MQKKQKKSQRETKIQKDKNLKGKFKKAKKISKGNLK